MRALRAVLMVLFICAGLTLRGAPLYAVESQAPAPLLSSAEQQALPQKITKAFNASKRSLDLQTEMPVKKAMKVQHPAIKLPGFSLSPFVVRVLLISAIIVIAVLILLNLKTLRWSDSRAKKLARQKEIEIDAAATTMRMEKAQLEADELARQGNFAEAMHALLLQSVNELRRRLRVSIGVSLTSREILHRIGLPPEGRNVFADIIRRVEISYFGSYQPGSADYAACRLSYDTLTDILRKGVAEV